MKLYLGLSHPLPCGPCLIGQMSQTVCRFIPGGVVPHVAADSVCLWEAVSPGCSYVTSVNWNLPRYRNGFITSVHYFVLIYIVNSKTLKIKKFTIQEIFL